jgi:hypothetical protein
VPFLTHFYDQTLAARATTEFDFNESGDYLEVGAEVVRVGLPEEVDPEVEMAGYIAPNVRLPVWNTRIVFSVVTMIKIVERIVDDIEMLI